MNFQIIQSLIPTGEVLVTLLGQPQKQWLTANVSHLPEFLKSKQGQDALLMFLEEFNDFVVPPTATK